MNFCDDVEAFGLDYRLPIMYPLLRKGISQVIYTYILRGGGRYMLKFKKVTSPTNLPSTDNSTVSQFSWIEHVYTPASDIDTSAKIYNLRQFQMDVIAKGCVSKLERRSKRQLQKISNIN